MTTHLHFHLGPVGGFIGQARRTRDYWAGSFILSWLIGKAIVAVEDANGKILLPVLGEETEKAGFSLVDPTYAAIKRSKAPKSSTEHKDADPISCPFLGTLTNHFLAEFGVLGDPEAAARVAAKEIRCAWINLANAVRLHVLDDFKFIEPPMARQRVCKIWDAQIGTENATPFWEIYWVAAPDTESGTDSDSPLDLRKLTRFSEDVGAPGDPDQSGNFCTMLAGLTDISGIERRIANQAFQEFWRAMRQHLNVKRYDKQDLKDKACLDLRPNESLSAPALVKRLFPLLQVVAREELVGVIGWIPDIRSAIGIEYKPSFGETIWDFLARWKVVRPRTRSSGEPDAPTKGETQSLLLWPSTSYMAATHWVARVLRSAPDEAAGFAAAIAEIGPQYARAEQSLWLRAVREAVDDDPPPFAFVDGAMFHRNRLELVEGDKSVIDSAVELLQRIYDSPIKPVDGVQKSYLSVAAHPGKPPSIGAPPRCYAIIRADGDHVGKTLNKATQETRVAISKLFNEFSSVLRGRQGAPTPDERLGVVAARNGVIIFAGADEILAFAPPEDALDIACEMHEAFKKLRDQAVSEAKKAQNGDAATIQNLTLSASVLYVDIRAPLRWAIRESAALLDAVAKEAAGRDALALGILEIEGLRSSFAAPWDGYPGGSNPINALQQLLKIASEEHAFVWSNELYHRLTDRLRPFLVPARHEAFPKAVKLAKEARDELGKSTDRDTELALARNAVRERLSSGAETTATDLAERFLQAATIVIREKEGPAKNQTIVTNAYPGLILPATWDILRYIGANWCKDTGETAAVPAEEAAA